MNTKKEFLQKLSKILRKRKNMPQVKDPKKIPGKTKKETVNPKSLIPSQETFNAKKVANIKKEIKEGSFNFKPIIVSKDNHILDGHHRWKAALGLWSKIPVIRIPKDRKDALDYLKKKVDGQKKTASWEMNLDYKSPYELGIYSKKTNEDNRALAITRDVPKGALVGAGIGAVAKGISGEPTPNLVRKAVQGKPLASEAYKKQINYPAAKRTFLRGVVEGKGTVQNLAQASKKLNLKSIKPQAIKGGLIGAATGAVIGGGINTIKYQAGRMLANTDSAESGYKKKVKKDNSAKKDLRLPK